MTDEKKVSRQKLCLEVNNGIYLKFQVLCTFCNDSIPISLKIFSLEVQKMTPFLANAVFFWKVTNSMWKEPLQFRSNMTPPLLKIFSNERCINYK